MCKCRLINFLREPEDIDAYRSRVGLFSTILFYVAFIAAIILFYFVYDLAFMILKLPHNNTAEIKELIDLSLKVALAGVGLLFTMSSVLFSYWRLQIEVRKKEK